MMEEGTVFSFCGTMELNANFAFTKRKKKYISVGMENADDRGRDFVLFCFLLFFFFFFNRQTEKRHYVPPFFLGGTKYKVANSKQL